MKLCTFEIAKKVINLSPINQKEKERSLYYDRDMQAYSAVEIRSL